MALLSERYRVRSHLPCRSERFSSDRPCDWIRQWKSIDCNGTISRRYLILEDCRNRDLADSSKAIELGRHGIASSDGVTYCYRPTSLPSTPIRSASHVGSLSFISSFSTDPAVTRKVAELCFNAQKSDHRSGCSSTFPPGDFTSRPRKFFRKKRIPFDLMGYGTKASDDLRHPLLFDTTVGRNIMPMTVRLKLTLEDNQNVMIFLSMDFSPLHHGICAITLLNNGMRVRPELMAGSFQQYDHAIAACRATSPSTDTEAVFFLHFLRLMYDIACACQKWSEKRAC